MGKRVELGLGRTGRLLALAMVLTVAACGPGAPAASQSPTIAAPSAEPTGAATAPPTEAPTAVITAAPDPSAATLACTDYLTAAEISTAIGLTASEGVGGQAMTAGEVICSYAFAGGSLTLSIYREPDAQVFYEGNAASLRNTVQVAGLGQAATYGDGPVGIVKDALAVLGDGVTFMLFSRSETALGQDALGELGELVLERL